MLNRRRFLKNSLTLGALAQMPWAWGKVPEGEPLLLSAVDDARGRHCLAGATAQGELAFISQVPERCHGGTRRPGREEVVMFARRPGRHFHVVNTATGKKQLSVAASEGRHFYGHGVFSPDGRYLYAAANRFETREGIVQVYDARKDYRPVKELSLDGIGPHELRLHPDGETLIVALGGIETHPDYGRVKLNLDSMAPALLLMNSHSGEIHARHTPSHHQLSCRHLDVAPDGTVILGYQFQGPEWETPPLIARLDGKSGEFHELTLPETLTPRLRNYIASIAVSRDGKHAAITAPRGNRVLILDTRDGRLLNESELEDAAGVVAYGDGFLISSGRGGLYRLSSEASTPQRLTTLPLHWDNHLTLA
ncbi:DUF1513 domain-containing protein [Pistricoccus aurantiacus]|uniref:DUF1513 domain-containing protein n=1 Tax=Pistricoccus aurantiacus TaxID=1883414 RepID=UPI001FE5B6D1|nr:DUF1513 domain-containing protein [Pistricoccus aurantiacus]